MFLAFAGVRNMSEQKNNETKQAKQKSDLTHRSKMILETSIDGFCVVGLDGRLLEVNSSLCNLTGYSKAELLKMKITDIEANETSEQVAQHIGKITTQGYDRFETKHSRKDGKMIDIEVSTQYCNFGEEKFLFSFFRDITEKKQLELEKENYKESLLKAQRQAYIGSMGMIVAHQVNQPLTKINILLDRVKDKAEDESCYQDVIRDVKESLVEVKEATSIIRKFRQYSKDSALEGAGKVNISAIADRVVSVLAERGKQAKMRISIKGLEDFPEVETNETALEQIFLLIIQNAIEAADGRKSHKLDITGKFADGNIELQFTDDCCGIAPGNLDRIFEPFFSTKTEDEGMGLGLDIVQQILTSCGGQIRVESKLGKGATFYVTLPISNTMGGIKNEN